MENTVDGSAGGKLVAEGIRVHFEGVRAVDGVDLTLEKGQIMGLIGPNGAGKTTFMNAVSSFVPLTGGRVVLDGVDVTGAPPHRLVAGGLGRTFPDVPPFPGLPGVQNVRRAPRRARHADHLPRLRAHTGAGLRQVDRHRHAGGDPHEQARRRRLPRREGGKGCSSSVTSPSTTGGSPPSSICRSRSTKGSWSG